MTLKHQSLVVKNVVVTIVTIEFSPLVLIDVSNGHLCNPNLSTKFFAASMKNWLHLEICRLLYNDIYVSLVINTAKANSIDEQCY